MGEGAIMILAVHAILTDSGKVPEQPVASVQGDLSNDTILRY